MLNPRALLTFLVLATVAALGLAPTSAQAAGGFTKQNWGGCSGGYNSGGSDTLGRTYVPCGDPSVIEVYAPDGTLVNAIQLDRYVTDVEPVGDGSLLYLAGYDAPQRLVRAADGSYSLDASWHPARYPMNGTTYPAAGLFVDSDAAGNVYYADGFWAASGNHTVVEYNPSGAFVTRFGAYKDKSWALGDMYWALGGIAVSPDGNRILTTETGNNRVQDWVRGSDGSFTSTGSLGGTEANNADRQGYCDFAGWEGKFAAPYDVSFDAAGNVYVINSSCTQVLRFSSDLSTLTGSADLRPGGGDSNRPHGFAVAANGVVFIGQSGAVLVPDGVSATVQAPSAHGFATSAGGGSVTTTPGSAAGPGARPSTPTSGAFRPSVGRMILLSSKRRGPYALNFPISCGTLCNMHIAIHLGKRTIATRQVAWWDGKRRVISIPLKRHLSKGTKLQVAVIATSGHGVERRATFLLRVAA